MPNDLYWVAFLIGSWEAFSLFGTLRGELTGTSATSNDKIIA
jgi:hypothetical protein